MRDLIQAQIQAVMNDVIENMAEQFIMKVKFRLVMWEYKVQKHLLK